MLREVLLLFLFAGIITSYTLGGCSGGCDGYGYSGWGWGGYWDGGCSGYGGCGGLTGDIF